jgi:hypothetical protein
VNSRGLIRSIANCSIEMKQVNLLLLLVLQRFLQAEPQDLLLLQCHLKKEKLSPQQH